MFLNKIKESFKTAKRVVQLGRQAQTELAVLQRSLAANKQDIADLTRHAKSIQYQNQVHLDRIKVVQKKMAGSQSHS
ncbi:hypothetical protein [Fructobacillus ficulneus]|uniref:Na+/proline symporter n=1 Tax=Fructobacillus ficulneus TaxID=157463 RepID=A0A0K8MIZ0_9LACO|nr:hypothetical protein [Fructobacillus ficulneus]GAP00506.1 Na+/proline symporter [Fructobacillus ficulneus]